MSSWQWRDAHASVRVCGIIVYCLDLGERGKVVGFVVQPGWRILSVGGSHGADAHGVLDKPFVDGLSSVGHENAAAEWRFSENVGEGGGVVDVEAEDGQSRIMLSRDMVLKAMLD